MQYIIDGGCENNSIDFTGGAGRNAMDRIVGGGGWGGVLVVVVVVVVAGRQKGPSNPTTATATRTDIIRLKITKTNQSNRLNYLSQHLTLFLIHDIVQKV